VEGKDIVIGLIQSVSQRNYDQKIFDQFGLLVVDECHHIASRSFSKALRKHAYKYTIGLSATPNRKDGLTPILFNYLGDLIHKEKREGSNIVLIKQLLISSKLLCYNTVFKKDGTVDTGAMTTALSNCQERNDLLIKILRCLFSVSNRKILLLSSRRKQLENINKMIEKASINKLDGMKITHGLYYGNIGTNKKIHAQMLQESAKCDVIIGTIQIASEALDIPALNTMILLSSTNDLNTIEQTTGRILRDFQNQYNPLIVELVDNCGNFVKHARTRSKYYKNENYVVTKLKIDIDLFKFGQSNKIITITRKSTNNIILENVVKNNKETRKPSQEILKSPHEIQKILKKQKLLKKSQQLLTKVDNFLLITDLQKAQEYEDNKTSKQTVKKRTRKMAPKTDTIEIGKCILD